MVVGIRDSKIKKRLLRDSELTLERAIDICKANEAAQAQMKVLTGAENSASVNMIRKLKKMNLRKKQVPVVEQATRNALTPKKKQCKRCGTAHKFRECPAWGATCNKCGGRNHHASKCLTRRVQVVGVDNDSTGDEGGFFVSAIHINTQQCELIALLTVCDSLVPLKVDSGAQVNILNLSDYEGLASKPKLLGICIVTVNHMGKKHRLQFVVVSKGRHSLIGASDSERLGLVTRECGVRIVCRQLKKMGS